MADPADEIRNAIDQFESMQTDVDFWLVHPDDVDEFRDFLVRCAEPVHTDKHVPRGHVFPVPKTDLRAPGPTVFHEREKADDDLALRLRHRLKL